MMEQLLAWLTFDMSPAKRKAVITVIWRLVIVGHIVVACGWALPLGISGFAYSKDVDERISSETEKTMKKVTDIEQSIKRTEVTVNTFAANRAAEQIRVYAKRLCKRSTSDVERAESYREIDRLQNEYMVVRDGKLYDIPPCERL